MICLAEKVGMYTTEGVILKRTDVGEHGSLFTIYTRDFGKIRALAQGVKKEGAKLKGHLEPLNLSSIGFVLGRNGERLTQATVLNHWPGVRENFEKLRIAYTIIEVIDKQCLLGAKDENLWGILTGSLSTLENTQFLGNDLDEFLQGFRKGLISALGYTGVSEDVFLRYNS